MATDTFVRNVILAALAAAFCLAEPSASADEGALDKFLGRWDVRVKRLQPEKPDVTYTETYEWVLQRKFIRGKTERKSDGTEDVIFAGYDPQTKGYPFWIFSSTGTYSTSLQAPGMRATASSNGITRPNGTSPTGGAASFPTRTPGAVP